MLAGFLGNAWAKIISVGAIVLAIAATLAKFFSAGKTAAIAEGQRQQLDNVAARNQVDAAVDASGDAAIRQQLRDQYTRH